VQRLIARPSGGRAVFNGSRKYTGL